MDWSVFVSLIPFVPLFRMVGSTAGSTGRSAPEAIGMVIDDALCGSVAAAFAASVCPFE